MEEKNDKKLGIQKKREEDPVKYKADFLLGNDTGLNGNPACSVLFIIKTSDSKFHYIIEQQCHVIVSFFSVNNSFSLEIYPLDEYGFKIQGANRGCKISIANTPPIFKGYLLSGATDLVADTNVPHDNCKLLTYTLPQRKTGAPVQTPVTVTDKQ